MWRSPTFVSVGVLVLLSACSDVSGPRESLNGEWDYSATIQAGALKCSLGGVTLTLTQQGTSFTGRASGGTTDCEGGRSQPLASSDVSGGSLSDKQVRFFIGGDDVLNEGVLSGNTITGRTTISEDGSKLTGTFTMVRR